MKLQFKVKSVAYGVLFLVTLVMMMIALFDVFGNML